MGTSEPTAACGHSDSGFTLLEVLVALAILAISLGVVTTALTDGLVRSTEAERRAEALLLARSLLAKVGTETPLRAGVTAGQVDDTYRWQVRTEPYGDAADRREWPVAAYSIVVEVSWNEGLRGRSAQLATLRLGPRGPSP